MPRYLLCCDQYPATVDIQRLEAALSFPQVVYAGDYRYLCSEAGQA